VWRETAGGEGDDGVEQVTKEREGAREMRFFLHLIRRAGLRAALMVAVRSGASSYWERLGGFHFTARPYVARAYEPTIRSLSLCTKSFSWSRHGH
jgi:hypothetical protein